MDDTLQIILIALAPIVFGPLLIWLRRKFKRKKEPNIIVQCPHCNALIGLDEFRNYICGSCGAAVGFYNLETKELLSHVKEYCCERCEGENCEGLITCTHCGHYHESRVKRLS